LDSPIGVSASPVLFPLQHHGVKYAHLRWSEVSSAGGGWAGPPSYATARPSFASAPDCTSGLLKAWDSPDSIVRAKQKTRVFPRGDHSSVPSSGQRASLSTNSPMDLGLPEPQYQYPPLGDNETKLLLLHPGQPDTPLRCSLQNLKTIENPSTPYKAVSYCWSEVPGFTFIECEAPVSRLPKAPARSCSAFDTLRRWSASGSTGYVSTNET